MVITALNLFVPKLFSYLSKWERLSATFEIKLTLVRTVLLRISSLLVLILTLFRQLEIKGLTQCWETFVGQQLYRLCIFNAITAIGVSLLIQLPMMLIFRRAISKTHPLSFIAHPEFDLVSTTLDLVYDQAICWMGIFYCPILPIATAAKLFIVYYIRYLGLVVYSSPPARLYGASRSTSLFMNVLLLTFISCVLPLGYHVTQLTPSKSCGPYRGLPTVWSWISNEVIAEMLKLL